MRKPIFLTLLALLLSSLPAWSQTLTRERAVTLAENFIVENGYTDASVDQVKEKLDFESLDFAESRISMLKQRHDTLRPHAIGAKRGRKGGKDGWSVAFDFTSKIRSGEEVCRVVTMDLDGSNIRIEHVDGTRKYFFGFN